MTTYYMDTSALGKRYMTEIGSNSVTVQTSPAAGNTILISELTTVEVCSAIGRKRRLKELSPADSSQLRGEFLTHVDEEYLAFPIDAPILARARDLVDKHPLRTLDAVQLASALEATVVLGEPLTFVSADTNLLAAAALEGLNTDNPLMHP
jgi:predicted nucleic acid-binding protein